MEHTPETLEKIRQKAIELFNDNNYDAIETELGYKEKNGIVTSKKCLRFGVISKKPLNEINPSKIIPKTFTLDNEEIETDVYEIQGINEAVPSYCNNSGSSSFPYTAPPPVSYNRSYARPLSGGMSGHSSPKQGYYSAGTLGGIVVDSYDGTLVGITNNHVGGSVGGNDPLSGIPLTITSNTTYGAKASAYRNIAFYSPSSMDRLAVNYQPDFVGSLKRAMPFRTTGNNTLDVALINLNNNLVSTNSWAQILGPFDTPPDFATSSEINSLTLNDPIFRSGRTLGAVGQGSCDIRMYSSSYNGSVNYGSYTINFIDTIRFYSPTTNVWVSSAGDSGSLLYGCVNSTNPATSAWKVIGLLFAGNSTLNYGVASRIDNLVNMFGVSAYKGEARSANPPLSSTITLDYTTFKDEVSANIGGKIYWNFGKI